MTSHSHARRENYYGNVGVWKRLYAFCCTFGGQHNPKKMANGLKKRAKKRKL